MSSEYLIYRLELLVLLLTLQCCFCKRELEIPLAPYNVKVMCRQGRRYSKQANTPILCASSSTSCGYVEFDMADPVSLAPTVGVYDCVDSGILEAEGDASNEIDRTFEKPLFSELCGATPRCSKLTLEQLNPAFVKYLISQHEVNIEGMPDMSIRFCCSLFQSTLQKLVQSGKDFLPVVPTAPVRCFHEECSSGAVGCLLHTVHEEYDYDEEERLKIKRVRRFYNDDDDEENEYVDAVELTLDDVDFEVETQPKNNVVVSTTKTPKPTMPSLNLPLKITTPKPKLVATTIRTTFAPKKLKTFTTTARAPMSTSRSLSKYEKDSVDGDEEEEEPLQENHCVYRHLNDELYRYCLLVHQGSSRDGDRCYQHEGHTICCCFVPPDQETCDPTAMDLIVPPPPSPVPPQRVLVTAAPIAITTTSTTSTSTTTTTTTTSTTTTTAAPTTTHGSSTAANRTLSRTKTGTSVFRERKPLLPRRNENKCRVKYVRAKTGSRTRPVLVSMVEVDSKPEFCNSNTKILKPVPMKYGSMASEREVVKPPQKGLFARLASYIAPTTEAQPVREAQRMQLINCWADVEPRKLNIIICNYLYDENAHSGRSAMWAEMERATSMRRESILYTGIAAVFLVLLAQDAVGMVLVLMTLLFPAAATILALLPPSAQAAPAPMHPSEISERMQTLTFLMRYWTIYGIFLTLEKAVESLIKCGEMRLVRLIFLSLCLLPHLPLLDFVFSIVLSIVKRLRSFFEQYNYYLQMGQFDCGNHGRQKGRKQPELRHYPTPSPVRCSRYFIFLRGDVMLGKVVEVADVATSIPKLSPSPLTPRSVQDAIEEDLPEKNTLEKKHPRRFSLAHQASCETQHLAGLRRQNTLQHRRQLNNEVSLRGQKILQQLNDEGVELIWTADHDRILSFSAVMSSTASLCSFVADVVHAFEAADLSIRHLESRVNKDGKGYDVLSECEGTRQQLLEAASKLTQSHRDLTAFGIYKQKREEPEIWFPRHISDLDKCSRCVTKYEPTTDPRHPGHGDEAYIARRQFLNDLALEYKHGDEIPLVDYTEAEHQTWKAVYEKLRELHVSHTCTAYRENLKMLEEENVLNSERIPQIRDINKFLQKKSGFILRPCSGLLSARDFLASLAFRVFQTTTYLRHSESPHHSPEPDLIHELLGHVPMFADPILAQMSQDIGLMSLGANDEKIEKLATVYWFIIEFGLCREDGRLKAIGAGLLSAYGELMHACSDVPQHKDFDPEVTALQTYEDSDYQPLYFVADSLHEALSKLKKYASSMDRPFSVIYNPFTSSVETIRCTGDLEQAFGRVSDELGAISHAAEHIKKST
ncbi:unnamed protein product [Caenorhabditis auriculariae]|uniref:Biopterin-dependent aromatic amino acid hydroxylase family profile domain-containing protein n=1 Tax=Caenorhabditis auriculariae TaxID=2777116 RepID=A0A8S1HAC3_9PELO|nr:unnamed protein product [Caenorhabditis auriculariae]